MTTEHRPGPFLKAAFFCEQTLESKDNVNSYIRVVDRVQTIAQLGVISGTPSAPSDSEDGPEETTSPPELPDSLPKFQWNAILVLLFVAGGALGRHPLQLRLETPDGLSSQLGGTVDIHFDRPNAVQNVHARMNLELEQEGVHWIHVLLDGREMTQVPLEVMYQRK